MAFYFSRRKLRPTEHEVGGELNIIPYLDILMNLIMFMLLSITGLAAFGILNVTAPNYAGANVTPPDPSEQPKLLLSVLIGKEGFSVASTGVVLGQQNTPPGQEADPKVPTIPKKADGTYDFAALTAQMTTVKTAVPTETKIIIGANGDIPYETLVETMDAVREGPNHELLFPDVTLATM